MGRASLRVAALLVVLWAPSVCSAQSGEDGPAMLQYGFRGFWTGAELGLAVGFLSTGNRFEDGEWRNLVFGAGIGALLGVGSGITLGLIDASSSTRPRYGWFVLRDMGYGALLGAFTGAAVGALFWVDDGRPKDVLIGLSAGALLGAAAGVVFGIFEGIGAGPRREGKEHGALSHRVGATRRRLPGVRLTLMALPSRMPALGPGLVGHF